MTETVVAALYVVVPDYPVAPAMFEPIQQLALFAAFRALEDGVFVSFALAFTHFVISLFCVVLRGLRLLFSRALAVCGGTADTHKK